MVIDSFYIHRRWSPKSYYTAITDNLFAKRMGRLIPVLLSLVAIRAKETPNQSSRLFLVASKYYY